MACDTFNTLVLDPVERSILVSLSVRLEQQPIDQFFYTKRVCVSRSERSRVEVKMRGMRIPLCVQ